MRLLQSLCSVPTAPFAEQHVVAYVRDFVARRPKLKLSSDATGNLLISLAGTGRGPRWVFTAHMDHPGFVAEAMVDRRTLRARFHGWVKVEYVTGTRVRFFDGGREVRGTVVEATAEDYDQRPVPKDVLVRVGGEVAPASVGMFDQGEGRVRGRRFYSRACDDLAGAAACLTMLDALVRRPPASPVAVLLTRAEEEGFVGCIAACRDGTLLRKTDRVIAIETSAQQPYAKQGDGVILRVGDRTSVFNSALTYFLAQQAEGLKQKQKDFRHQRALMPGGTCEATVYDVYGYTAASLCVALGNYHNMDVAKGKIGPEYIDVSDWQNMVKLFVHLARTGHAFEPGHAALKARVLARFEKVKHWL